MGQVVVYKNSGKILILYNETCWCIHLYMKTTCPMQPPSTCPNSVVCLYFYKYWIPQLHVTKSGYIKQVWLYEVLNYGYPLSEVHPGPQLKEGWANGSLNERQVSSTIPAWNANPFQCLIECVFNIMKSLYLPVQMGCGPLSPNSCCQ